MSRYIFLVYGVLCYALFVATFLYAVGFVANVVVPKSIDTGEPAAFGPAMAINILLLGLFGLQHTVMARPAFKRWWTRICPRPMERPTFVLATCVCFALLFVFWRPLPEIVWSVQNPVGQVLLWAGAAIGWLMVLWSTFLIDHFELFGVKQPWAYFRGRALPTPQFRSPAMYKLVRHPIMLGFLIAFWCTPHMSVGHLLFAIVTTCYIVVGVTIEERDLIAYFGQQYIDYKARVRGLVPLPRRNKSKRELVLPSTTPAHSRG